jgi:MFS family permease
MKSSKVSGAVRSHPLIQYLVTSRGNPKALLLMEPLWGIPHSLIAPFATLYMTDQGVTEVQIGLILTIFMIVQVFFCFAGGILSDKWGRKTTTIFGDFFGWIVACLIWAVSSNFWLFLIAVLLNSFEQVNQTAWHCLLIEDAPEKDRLAVYTWSTIGGLVAVFFAPISRVLVDRFSLVSVVSVLYLSFAITMTIKSLLTWRCATETRQGQIRLAQTKDLPMRKMLYEYKGLLPQIFRSKTVMQIMAVNIILQIATMVNTTFFPLNVTGRLGLAARELAVFPILNAAVMLVFMFAIQHRLEHLRHKTSMWIGLVVYGLNQLLFILMPPGSIALVFVYVFLGAVANALVVPRKDTLLALSMDAGERARILALVTSFTIGFSAPSGLLTGFLSSLDQRLPFVFILILFAIAIWIVKGIQEPKADADIVADAP